MTNEILVTPREYGRIISRLAPLSIFSGFYALLMGHSYDIAIVPLSVGCTTYLYWHNPTYSWRRKLDMVTVMTLCLYQAYRALYADYMYYYYILHATGIISYLLGIHCYYERNEKYLGMIIHTGIHIFVNI